MKQDSLQNIFLPSSYGSLIKRMVDAFSSRRNYPLPDFSFVHSLLPERNAYIDIVGKKKIKKITKHELESRYICGSVSGDEAEQLQQQKTSMLRRISLFPIK